MILLLLVMIRLNSVPDHFRDYFERADMLRRRSLEQSELRLASLPETATEERENAIRNVHHAKTTKAFLNIPPQPKLNNIGTINNSTVTHIIDDETMAVLYYQATLIITKTPTKPYAVKSQFFSSSEWIVISDKPHQSVPADNGVTHYTVEKIDPQAFAKFREAYYLTTVPPTYIPQNIQNYWAGSTHQQKQAIREAEQSISNLEIDLRSEPNSKEQSRLKQRLATERKAYDKLLKDDFRPTINFRPFEEHSLGRLPPCTIDTVIDAKTAIVKDASGRTYVITKTDTRAMKRGQTYDKRTIWQTAIPSKTNNATITQRLAGRDHIVVEPSDDDEDRINGLREVFNERFNQ